MPPQKTMLLIIAAAELLSIAASLKCLSYLSLGVSVSEIGADAASASCL